MSSTRWQTLIDLALEEDLGQAGDLTSRYFIPQEATSRVVMVARESCTLSGIEVAAAVFSTVDDTLAVHVSRRSGQVIDQSETNRAPILEISGSTRSILTAERTALNFAQRLSGVATLTADFVRAVEGTKATILDTRKTTPGWRHLEKEAVRHGGGENHRMGLYDRVMIKDNHLAAEGGLPLIQRGIDALRQDHPEVEVEVEADTVNQVEAFLTLEGVDYILLDNMSLEELRKAVSLTAELPLKLEASGGIQLENARSIAETGVDYISIGALTHSARSIDLALDTLE